MADGGPGSLLCEWCRTPVLEDQSVRWIPHLGEHGPPIPKPWHLECFMRSIIGGLNHLKHTCTCCGGSDPPDPPDMTEREAAIAAVAYYERHKPADYIDVECEP